MNERIIDENSCEEASNNSAKNYLSVNDLESNRKILLN